MISCTLIQVAVNKWISRASAGQKAALATALGLSGKAITSVSFDLGSRVLTVVTTTGDFPINVSISNIEEALMFDPASGDVTLTTDAGTFTASINFPAGKAFTLVDYLYGPD